MTRILCTGGAGFVGTNVATYLLSLGFEVVAFDNLSRIGVKDNILEHEHYQFIQGDVRNPSELKAINGIDAIIHLAANPGVPWSIKDPRADFEKNVIGTYNVLEYARDHGNIPVVYASTNKVYSDKINTIEMSEWRTRFVFGKSDWVINPHRLDRHGRPTVKRGMVSDYLHGIPETYSIDGEGKYPHSPYGVSKLSGDLYAQEFWQMFQVPTVINRCSCIYGKYQQGVADQGWVGWFMIAKLLGKKLTLYGDGKQVRDALYAKDLAKLFYTELMILLDPKVMPIIAGQVFNVGGGWRNTISLLEAIELIEFLDKGEHPPLQYELAEPREADFKVYYSDVKKVSLIWQPETSVNSGFSQTYDWFKENMALLEQYR